MIVPDASLSNPALVHLNPKSFPSRGRCASQSDLNPFPLYISLIGWLQHFWYNAFTDRSMVRPPSPSLVRSLAYACGAICLSRCLNPGNPIKQEPTNNNPTIIDVVKPR